LPAKRGIAPRAAVEAHLAAELQHISREASAQQQQGRIAGQNIMMKTMNTTAAITITALRQALHQIATIPLLKPSTATAARACAALTQPVNAAATTPLPCGAHNGISVMEVASCAKPVQSAGVCRPDARPLRAARRAGSRGDRGGRRGRFTDRRIVCRPTAFSWTHIGERCCAGRSPQLGRLATAGKNIDALTWDSAAQGVKFHNGDPFDASW